MMYKQGNLTKVNYHELFFLKHSVIDNLIMYQVQNTSTFYQRTIRKCSRMLESGLHSMGSVETELLFVVPTCNLTFLSHNSDFGKLLKLVLIIESSNYDKVNSN